MPSSESLSSGIYETLIDKELNSALEARPELRPVFGKLDDEVSAHAYSQFLWSLLRAVLPAVKADRRLALVNKLVEVISATDGQQYTQERSLLETKEPLLLEIRSGIRSEPLPRPGSPIGTSSLLTGAVDDPQLEHELRAEMATADRVDILVSFIKWSGLRLLQPSFENLAARKVPVRIITTSYMGASDPEAVAWLASQPGFSVKVSYETDRTRLHAKAYYFSRRSGFCTAYVGSANMSQPAMTSGLEWTIKATRQDMPHVLGRFIAEFETYWQSPEFTEFTPDRLSELKNAINLARSGPALQQGTTFFAEITPRPFQARILEALEVAREAGSKRNLVVAATGTGKTVISAFDYAEYRRRNPQSSRLLFVVHRKEILQQARDCFRAVLRDPNFGELLVDGESPQGWVHVFASVQSLANREPWNDLGDDHFQFIVVDEAHHGVASSYRPLFDHLKPDILLGLTATPERMDGTSLLPDFDHRFAAEIRLPEALGEKLLCPFHYFGVSDPVALSDDSFWSNGKYDINALTEAYIGDDIRARQRLDVILSALRRYQPNLDKTRAIGFCASIRHAIFMAEKFRECGYSAETVLGDTNRELRSERIQAFRQGRLTFLFVVDVFSEGIDIPEIDLVMFLRPTESLTVFLQQLGRGLRHAHGKDCLTVLDFVGQSHRRYRMDRKFAALLPKQRRRIDKELEHDFPNLPPGCNIQLERVAREHILANIRSSLANITAYITETISTFEAETGQSLTFGNFVEASDLTPLTILKNRTWSGWKRLAGRDVPTEGPDLLEMRKALRRLVLRTNPRLLEQLARFAESTPSEIAASLSTEELTALHYLFWSRSGPATGIGCHIESLNRIAKNPDAMGDIKEIVAWRRRDRDFATPAWIRPGFPLVYLHAAYGLHEIKAAFGLATLDRSGSTGVGVLHDKSRRTYIHLVTFRKEDSDFAPTTRYKDYLVSLTRLHWESQSGTTRNSTTGRNYIYFAEKNYTILFFARLDKRVEGETAPFLFLGEAERLVSFDGDRPISMVWDLAHAVPAALFEEGRVV